ncbi:MAG: methyl-accepting chemotaxis protein [Anaerolineae bacterium]
MLDRLLSPAVKEMEVLAKARAINLLALAVAVIVPLYVVVASLGTPGQITAGGAASLGGAFLLALVCYGLGKAGRVGLAGYILLAGLFLAVSLYLLDPGNTITDLAAAPALYLLIILPAGYVLHPLASFVVTTLALAYTLGLLFLAPPPAYAAYEGQVSLLSNVVLVFAVAYVLSAVTWVFSLGLRRTLHDAQLQNRELRRATEELEAKRRLQAETGQQILEVAERLAKYSTRQSSGSSRQAAAIAQVSSSIEELNQTAHEIAENACLVDEAARQTLQSANEGQEVLVMHNEAMGLIQVKAEAGVEEATDLETRLKQISRVATIMSNIASQIQLVAFNATLEAAEAGETGQRFGVVASEVKNLAADSLQQAKQVADIIRRVQDTGEAVVTISDDQVRAVSMGTSLSGRSSAANQAIIEAAARVAEQVGQIQQTTAQQQQASEQIVASMQEIRAVVDRWVVSSYQMDEMVSRLKLLAGELG